MGMRGRPLPLEEKEPVLRAGVRQVLHDLTELTDVRLESPVLCFQGGDASVECLVFRFECCDPYSCGSMELPKVEGLRHACIDLVLGESS